MLEVQKQKEKEIDREHVLTIDFGKGDVKVEQQENQWAEFHNQNDQVNQYMKEYGVGNTLDATQAASSGQKFKPFEFQEGLDQKEMNEEEIIESLNNFQFKACKMSDEKTAKVYKNLKKEAK